MTSMQRVSGRYEPGLSQIDATNRLLEKAEKLGTVVQIIRGAYQPMWGSENRKTEDWALEVLVRA